MNSELFVLDVVKSWAKESAALRLYEPLSPLEAVKLTVLTVFPVELVGVVLPVLVVGLALLLLFEPVVELVPPPHATNIVNSPASTRQKSQL